MPLKAPTGVNSDVVVVIPAEDVENSSGASIDIGSTMGKIIYRSNKEYKDGKPIQPMDDASKGQVHFAMFQRSDITGMVSYIKEHADLKADDKGELIVKSSGVGAAYFKKEIKEGLNCKLNILPESDCFTQAFFTMEKIMSEEELFVPLPKEVQDQIAATKAAMEEVKAQMQKATKAFDNVPEATEATPEEDRPRLLVQAGSGTAIMQMLKDGTCSYVDGIFTGGRFMYGLGSFLTGENDFSKMVAMAEGADGKTVDLWMSDMMEKSSDGEEGVYSVESGQDLMLSPFGKGTFTRRENVKKADLAFAALQTGAMIHAQQVHTTCKVVNASHVYFVGNMFNTPLMMSLIAKKMNELSTFLPAKNPYEIHFIKNGGMLGAIGAFLMKPKEETKEETKEE